MNYFSNKNLPINDFMEHFNKWLNNNHDNYPDELPEDLKIFSPIQDIKKEPNNEINYNEVLENISNYMTTSIIRIPIRPENPKGSNNVFPGRYIHNRQ